MCGEDRHILERPAVDRQVADDVAWLASSKNSVFVTDTLLNFIPVPLSTGMKPLGSHQDQKRRESGTSKPDIVVPGANDWNPSAWVQPGSCPDTGDR